MKETKKAFTIVEISLAMTFLAVLLVAIATLIMRITGIYQKGLTLRSINSAGTEIIEDMTRTVGAASYLLDVNNSVVGDNGAVKYEDENNNVDKYYYAYTNRGQQYSGGKFVNAQLYGVFCTGSYSYVWNTAQTLRQDTFKGLTVSVGGENKHPKFAKIYDPEQASCRGDNSVATQGQAHGASGATISLANESYYTDLIGEDELDISMYEFNVTPVTQSSITKQSFVSANFILATTKGGVNINSNGDFCRGEGHEYSEEYNNSDFNYCAVNKFSFSVRTGGNSIKEG